MFEKGFLAQSQQEAEAEFQRYENANPFWAVKFRLLEANSMLFRGMYEDSLRALSNHPIPEDSEALVEQLAIESVALARQQQTALAEERLARAEDICRGSDLHACGDALTARGILLVRQGRFDDARGLFLQALDFARGHRNEWLQVSSLVNLGYAAMQVDHYDEAVDWLRTAQQKASAHDYENLALGAAGNLGWAYFQLGDDDRALEQFLAAEITAARLGNVRNELKWISDAGYVYADSGDWYRAGASYHRAFSLAREINSKEDIVNALEDLAYISEFTGKLDDATEYVSQVDQIETAESGRPSAYLMFTMGRLAAARREYPKAEADFRSVQNDSASLVTTKLYAGYELAKLYQLQKKYADAERMYKTTLVAYDAARAKLRSEESQLPYGAHAREIYEHYISLLVDEGRTDAALEVADQSRAQTLENGLDPSGHGHGPQGVPLKPRQVARKTGSTLLFYWLGEEQSYLWAITPVNAVLFKLPAQREIAIQIQRYQKALLDARDPLETEDPDGQALYKELVAPAADLLDRRRTPVIVLADGILSQLNLETLLVPRTVSEAQPNARSPAKLHYLLEDATFSSAPSIAMLAAAEPGPPAGERILILGNPDSPDQDFPSLPMFGFEMTRIESHFATTQLTAFTGAQATPAAYLASGPQSYSYIHFVSHAVASQTNPLDSAIILSNANGQEDSYRLYAREIIKHPIDAKLVTISACYGSGTRAYAGEGLVGLSWAFLRAGAQRVIGSLWEVSDDSTPRLMDTMYQGLTTGQAPAVALRNAKLALLHSQTRFRAPYYWAPFQIYSRR